MPLRWIETTLEELREQNLLRALRRMDGPAGPLVDCGGRRLVNLASNNYLDLARHEHIREAVREAVDAWGWGAGASQLVSGYTALHEELCRRLAAFEETEDAVLFPTGFQANVGAVCALAGRGDRILLDKLCHASLVDGARLSGATIRVYPHGHVRKAGRLLETPHAGRTLLLTDSIFSMDGDCAPLKILPQFCRIHGATLLVDEAHATGLLGIRGSGALEMLGVKKLVPVVVGTLSKALGGVGGFVAGSAALCDLLRNRARSLIYTTAPPPAACAAALAALDIVEEEPWRRQRALAHARDFRARLRAGGVNVPEGLAAIVPVVTGSEASALALSSRLLEAGYLAPAIRPPTVPRGTSRVRFSWMATHGEEDVEGAAAVVIAHAASA